MPLIKCKKCQKHNNPIMAITYAWNAQNKDSPLLRSGTAKDVMVCEYCGWKVN